MIYYELSKAVADHYHDGVRYWVLNDNIKSDYVTGMQQSSKLGNLKLLHHSERAWQEQGDTVKFIKNRHTGLMTPIDMREFFLVKLQARSV
jgi:hypothetical protein